MFGKLLKNDLKAQLHSMSSLFLCISIVAVAAELFTLVSDSKTVKVLGGFLVFLALGFAFLTVVIACAMMFSKTMFGRAGYLTLTLPVKTDMLLISKSLSSLIWIFTSFALFVGSIFLWIYQVQEVLGEEMMDTVEDLLSLFGVPSILTITIGISCLCVSLAVLVLLTVQVLHLSITASNVSPISKFGNIGTIVIFFAVLYVLIELTGATSNLLPFGFVITPDSFKITSNIIEAKELAGAGSMAVEMTGTIFRLILAVVLHFPTAFLVKHKINVA